MPDVIDPPCAFLIVGQDDTDNFRLGDLLRQARGGASVRREFELRRAWDIAASHDGALLIYLDLFAFPPADAIAFIAHVREERPHIVFCLYVRRQDFRPGLADLPAAWAKRLGHYYRLYKPEDGGDEFETYVRASLHRGEWEAIHNVTGEPIRLTPAFQKGLVGPTDLTDVPIKQAGKVTFISYARADWDHFVSMLVGRLKDRREEIWIDQEYIQQGDDYRDAIGQALEICDRLLLVVSPLSIGRPEVKREYRYFLDREKRILPIMCERVAPLPFELAGIQYLNFCGPEREMPFDKLYAALAR